MMRNRIRAEEGKSFTNIPQEGITMMFSQFSRRIGIAIVVGVIVGLAIGAVSASVALAQSGPFSLSPASGVTTPGGRLDFDMIANPNDPAVYSMILVDDVQPTVLPYAPTITVIYQVVVGAAIVPSVTVAPGVWNRGTIYVGTGTPTGVYTITMAIFVQGNNGQAQYFVNYTLQVSGGTPSSGPGPLPQPGTGIALRAYIAADRGCQEQGQNPVYRNGDPITVQIRVDGVPQAFITILDIVEGLRPQVIVQQVIQGNRNLEMRGQISPPFGRETLRMTVEAGGQTTVSQCTFTSTP
ncbi:hypothetical protein HYR54_05050 [Candidatus Acetothermia bacterium]|nr:hypothetical protein [Candidatus Acetothermia bacterium]